MVRRFFWLFLGIGVGMGSSWWVTRRVKEVAARYTPEHISNEMASSVRSLGRDLRLSIQDGREAMAQREAELRFDVPPEVADEPEATRPPTRPHRAGRPTTRGTAAAPHRP